MGNLLGAPVTEKSTKSGMTLEGVKFAVSSMQGWRVHMEDAHIAESNLYATLEDNTKLELPGHALFAVFDGHGGSYSATYAGKNLCRVLSKQPPFVRYAQLFHSPKQGQQQGQDSDQLAELLKEALTDAFIDLDREIACALKGSKVAHADQPYHLGQTDTHDTTHNNKNSDEMMDIVTQDSFSSQPTEDEGDSGTTACVIFLTPQFVICANAGDSRAILRTVQGMTLPMSYDHKPDDESEERRIRAAGGYVAGGRVEGDLAVSRGLGDFRFKNFDTVLKGLEGEGLGEQKVSPLPDISIHARQGLDFCLIACDGIWDVQTNEHASKLVSDLFDEGESDLGLVCEEVCDVCLRLGSKDNMTVLIVQFLAGQLKQPQIPVGEGGGGGVVLTRRLAREAENGPAS